MTSICPQDPAFPASQAWGSTLELKTLGALKAPSSSRGAVGMSTVQRDRLFTRGSYKAAKGQLELGRSHSATDSQGRGCECIAEE